MGDERFRELRENYYEERGDIMNDLNQTDFSKQIGLSRAIIIKLENGETKGYKTDILKKYSDFFGVSTDYILGLSNLKTKDEDIKMISGYTGLNEESLQVLNDMNTQLSPEHERWIATLNAIIHNPNILYVISDIIYHKKLYGVLEESRTPDKEGLNDTKISQVFNDKNDYRLISQTENGSMLLHTITDKVLEAAYWKELESLINSLKEKGKGGDINGKESTIPGKRNRQCDKAKRSKA